jgi:hypothetical protein
MCINRLLKGSKLGPDEIKRLNAAYTYALRSLSVVDRNDPLTEMLARKIKARKTNLRLSNAV